MKLFAVFGLLVSVLFATEDIRGFWKTANGEGQGQCVVAVYEHDGVHYGRIIGSYNEEGKMDDTIYTPKEKAPGLAGTPFYSGLDLIWDLIDVGVKFKGKIVDPRNGNVYNSELWVDKNGDLVVRGKWLMFGRNQVWSPATESDFPQDFKLPDVTEFVPSVPQAN